MSQGQIKSSILKSMGHGCNSQLRILRDNNHSGVISRLALVNPLRSNQSKEGHLPNTLLNMDQYHVNERYKTFFMSKLSSFKMWLSANFILIEPCWLQRAFKCKFSVSLLKGQTETL